MDLTRRNPNARLRNVRSAPGPLGRPGGSIKFLGSQTSYIQFPNRRGGALDTSYSMTVLAWVYPEKLAAGPLFNYHPSARGVHFWLRTRGRLYARFMRRKGRRYTRPVISRFSVRPKMWQFLGASYNRKTGTSALWRNGKKIAKKFIGRIRLATNYPVRMGARSGNKRYFKGRVTCLQVFSRALTARQVRLAAKKCFEAGKFWLSQCPKEIQLQSTLFIGNLSKDVFERRTSTGSDPFSLFTCLDTNKFVLLSFFSLIKTIYPRVSTEPLPNDAKSPLPVDVHRSKTL